jgi:cytochrome P450
MPFLEGNRQCVGMALARVNYTATLATLLSRFSFRLADDMGGPEGVRKSEAYYITVQPKDGLRMHCIPRPCA